MAKKPKNNQVRSAATAARVFTGLIERAVKAGLKIRVNRFSVQLWPENRDDCRKYDNPVSFRTSSAEDCAAFRDIVVRRERQERRLLGNREKIRQLMPAAEAVGLHVTANSVREGSHYLSAYYEPAGQRIYSYWPVTDQGLAEFAGEIAKRQSRMDAVAELQPKLMALMPLAEELGCEIVPRSEIEYFFEVRWPNHMSAYPYGKAEIQHLKEALEADLLTKLEREEAAK